MRIVEAVEDDDELKVSAEKEPVEEAEFDMRDKEKYWNISDELCKECEKYCNIVKNTLKAMLPHKTANNNYSVNGLTCWDEDDVGLMTEEIFDPIKKILYNSRNDFASEESKKYMQEYDKITNNIESIQEKLANVINNAHDPELFGDMYLDAWGRTK